MGKLDAILGTLDKRITQYRDSAIGEQNTKSVLIEPLLRVLGWDVEDYEEVQREYKPKPADNPVDYALLILRAPRLFVEAKALGGNLDDRKWANQIMGYAAVTGVEWVVLTDGNEYRIYNAHAPVPIEEKLFRTVRITDDRDQASEILELLSRAQVQENLILILWKSHFVDRQIRVAIENLYSPEPDHSFVRFLQKRLPNLSSGEVKAGLTRLRVRLDFPSAPLAVTRSPIVPEVGAGQQISASDDSDENHGEGTPWRNVTLEELIADRQIRPPLELHKTYKGQRLVGRIAENGKVSWSGQDNDSLSTAAGYARASIIGSRPGRKFPQTNGWTFWQFIDSDGKIKSLDVLRQRYFDSHSGAGR
jgi:predicted type IV restriction endonuclease